MSNIIIPEGPDVAMFTSPHSGRNWHNRKRVKTLSKIVGNHGVVYYTSTLDELERKICEVHKYNPGVIIIDGGDGSVSLIIDMLMKYWPEEKELPYFGLLPGGTFNILSKVAEIKKWDEKRYLEDIISTPKKKQRIRFLDMMKMEDNRGVKKYGFSFGTGFPVTLLEEIYKKKRLKYLRVAQMAARLLFSKFYGGEYHKKLGQRYPMDINGNEGEWFGFMAQTIQTIGLPRSKPFYMAHQAPKEFHALGTKADVIKGKGYWGMLFFAGPIYLGMPDFYTGVDIDEHANQMYVASEKEFKYQINGDIEDTYGNRFKANRVDIEHGITLNLILPRPKL